MSETVVRIEIVETDGDSRVPDRILEHYVIDLQHPIAVQAISDLRATVRQPRLEAHSSQLPLGALFDSE